MSGVVNWHRHRVVGCSVSQYNAVCFQPIQDVQFEFLFCVFWHSLRLFWGAGAGSGEAREAAALTSIPSAFIYYQLTPLSSRLPYATAHRRRNDFTEGEKCMNCKQQSAQVGVTSDACNAINLCEKNRPVGSPLAPPGSPGRVGTTPRPGMRWGSESSRVTCACLPYLQLRRCKPQRAPHGEGGWVPLWRGPSTGPS